MKSILSLLVLLLFVGSMQAADMATMEQNIMDWSKERLSQLEKNKQVHAVIEWKKHIDKNNVEWLAVSLAVHYTVDKALNQGLKGKRTNTPELDANIKKDKERLRLIGEYLIAVNQKPLN